MARPFSTQRVFFALWPSAAATERLAALAQEVAARTGGRAPPAANMHVTVAFIGEATSERVDALRAIGESVSGNAAPFALSLDFTGTFRRTGITWAGSTRVPEPLARLARNLFDALALQDFAVEDRAFSPHVTLARRCRAPQIGTLATSIDWMATRLALNASESGQDGPHYREIDAWPFAAPAAADGAPPRSPS